ncbi:hypothetical protein DSM104299_00293 [Baekduia alba]|uniref:hypothetical protein n=1 Tax=Baekduia alba TaxID=2997333 RepID=UPI002341FEA7|nr:hypothetical protein [Baekduia alba]WCB91620.1 hypothetical protein DSM104299_00293 [Baekduia alba]
MSGTVEREGFAAWRTRLRWRLSGAWQWPTFAALVVVDTVVLARLPFSGGRSSLLGSLLAAGLLNVLVVAVAPRVGTWALRVRRPDLPREIAADRAGAIGMAGLSVLLIAGGVAHRGALRDSDQVSATALREARVFAAHRAPARYLPLHGEDTWRSGADLFRTCWAGPDPRKDFCVFVRMDEGLPVKRVDPDQRPNATVAGPDNPGRIGG